MTKNQVTRFCYKVQKGGKNKQDKIFGNIHIFFIVLLYLAMFVIFYSSLYMCKLTFVLKFLNLIMFVQMEVVSLLIHILRDLVLVCKIQGCYWNRERFRANVHFHPRCKQAAPKRF